MLNVPMERVPLQVQDDPTGDWQKARERNKVKAKIFIEEDIFFVVVVVVSIVVLNRLIRIKFIFIQCLEPLRK